MAGKEHEPIKAQMARKEIEVLLKEHIHQSEHRRHAKSDFHPDTLDEILGLLERRRRNPKGFKMKGLFGGGEK